MDTLNEKINETKSKSFLYKLAFGITAIATEAVIVMLLIKYLCPSNIWADLDLGYFKCLAALALSRILLRSSINS